MIKIKLTFYIHRLVQSCRLNQRETSFLKRRLSFVLNMAFREKCDALL